MKRLSIFVAAFGLLGVTTAANASPYVVTLEQVGSNVVATGSGEFDLTGLLLAGSENGSFVPASISPKLGEILSGDGGIVDIYLEFSGPSPFGSGSFATASSDSGDKVGVLSDGGGALIVPQGYVSGTALSDSSTYDNATFTSLALTPGTYEWTWGRGADQSFTLDVVATPLPAALPLFASGLGAMGFFGWRRKRKVAAASVAA